MMINKTQKKIQTNQKLIALLDDDHNFCDSIAEILDPIGVIKTFQKIKYFEEFILKNKPSMVLIDLNLNDPKADGYKMIQRIKQLPDSHLISVVMLTGADNAYRQAFHIGVDDYIQKPIIPDFFLKKIENILFQNEQKIHCNSLTGLPGIWIIEDQFMKKCAEKIPFYLIYIDIDHFKAFNDEKGIKAGDSGIRILSDILKEARNQYSRKELFIGHLGGDDFFLMGNSNKMKETIQEIYKKFSQNCSYFFTAKEIYQKYYQGRDRNGILQNIPILSLSTVLIFLKESFLNNDKNLNFKKISKIAGILKKKAKSKKGNSMVEIKL